MARTKIVILGGGFGGAYCARKLQRSLRGLDADVLLIDRNNYFVFTPLLVEAGTGSLEPRHAVVPIRDFLRTTQFRMGTVTAIDPARREVLVHFAGAEAPTAVPYDHLVIALGSTTMMPPIPGLREHAFEMKGMADSVGLRDRVIHLLEEAVNIADPEERRARLHLVVVGASFTGVETAGEFVVFMREAARQYPGIDPKDCRITVVERAVRVLPALPPALADYAVVSMERRGVDVRLATQVMQVRPTEVVLSTGETLRSHTVVWCAGIEAIPLLRDSPLPRTERGYLKTTPELRVEGVENVWAIGDCAAIPAADGTLYPPTAQHAIRQGSHLAKSLARVLRGQPALPTGIKSLGSIAAIGCRTGVASLFGLNLSGFPAWFVWRTVYLLKMPTLSRKVRVGLDWAAHLLFPRDVVQLGVHEGPRRNKERKN